MCAFVLPVVPLQGTVVIVGVRKKVFLQLADYR